jgi:hypothetical protein
MTRIEWERMLHDSAALTQLVEWSRSVRVGEIAEVPVSHCFATEPAPNDERPSAAVLAANNRSTLGAPPFHDVARFLPDVADLGPLEALRALETRFRAEPSQERALLLQSAMNRIYAAPSLDESHRTAVERAAALFSESDTKNVPTQTDNIWYTLYEHADFGGRASYESMTPGPGYWRRPTFAPMGMNDIFSSLSFGASADEVGGVVLLFEHERYFGQYRAYIPTPGQTSFVNYVGNDFNDKTESALIVRRFPRETPPLSLDSLVQKSKIIDIINATPKVRPDGDPIFTWDMWPAGGPSNDWHPNDVNSIFIYVIVPIMVHTPWPYPDYHAQARYWIFLYVDGNGKLQGYVAYWGYWVEGGSISGDVEAGLRDAIPGTIPQVNALVGQAISLANAGGTYSYVYYLPGRFQLAGNVFDDVTVVAVRR